MNWGEDDACRADALAELLDDRRGQPDEPWELAADFWADVDAGLVSEAAWAVYLTRRTKRTP